MIAHSDFTLIGSYWPDTVERQHNLLAFLANWHQQVHIKLLTSEQPRTHSINQLLTTVNTPYVGVADVDGLLDPSILFEVRQAFIDGADVVYPYSRIRQGDEYWNPKYNFGILVFFNTDKYRSIGGENEKFVGWGWEDFERYYRALNNGLSIIRLDNDIEHQAHPHNRSDPELRRANYRLMLAEKRKYDRTNQRTINRDAE